MMPIALKQKYLQLHFILSPSIHYNMLKKEFRKVGSNPLMRFWIKLKFVFGRDNQLIHRLQKLNISMENDFHRLSMPSNWSSNGVSTNSNSGNCSSDVVASTVDTFPPVLLVGDFNIVHNIGPFTSYPYGILSKDLLGVFKSSSGGPRNCEPSWPMPLDPEFGSWLCHISSIMLLSLLLIRQSRHHLLSAAVIKHWCYLWKDQIMPLLL